MVVHSDLALHHQQLSTSNYNMLTLAIGDFFIPERVIELPPKFCKLLAPNAPSFPSNPKISQVLCLGNITQSASTLRFLHDLSPSFHIVRGEFDNYHILTQQLAHLGQETENPLPFYKVVTADNFRIGITSGYQDVPRHDPLLLLTFAREIDVDILIWGGSHNVEAYTLDNKFFINPGSATGAYNFNWPEVVEKDEEVDYDDSELGDEINEEGNKTIVTESNNSERIESSTAPEAGGDQNDQAEKLAEETPEVSPLAESTTPSFCLLDTQGSQCTLYIYTQVNDEVKVDKVMYLKDT